MFIEKKAEILTVCNIGQVKKKCLYYIFINILLRPKVSYALATGRNLIFLVGKRNNSYFVYKQYNIEKMNYFILKLFLFSI